MVAELVVWVTGESGQDLWERPVEGGALSRVLRVRGTLGHVASAPLPLGQDLDWPAPLHQQEPRSGAGLPTQPW